MSDLIKKAREKADRVEKPIAVEVSGIGTMHVRPRLMGERDKTDEAVKDGDFDTVCFNVARLLCNEDGSRKSPDEVREWAKVLARLPESDIVTIGSAADGTDPGN